MKRDWEKAGERSPGGIRLSGRHSRVGVLYAVIYLL